MTAGERAGRGRRRGGAPAPDIMDVAVRYLARKARSVFEVRRHLSSRGYDAAMVEEAVLRLIRVGHLDDDAFALRYAEWAAGDRPMGRRRLAADLRKRGVGAAVVERALEACCGPDDESAALEAALSRAAGRLTGPVDAAARRRIAAQLLRRGFRPGAVIAAVDAWCRARGGPADDEGHEGEVDEA